MKRVAFIFLALAVLFVSCGGKEPKKTVLTFTSWRTEDIERMERILSVFNSAHEDIEVKFTPIKDTEYDAQLRTSLASGVGSDIIFLRSFTSVDMYKSGYLLDLNDIVPGIEDFPSAAKSAWSWDKYIYGIPFVGVTHGVYYNKDIFAKYSLKPPVTWDEFIQLAEVLKENGETVFAQGTVDAWTLYEVIFSGLGANFYGGEETRQKLLKGEVKFTDEPFVTALKKLYELKDFFPDGYNAIDYVAMQQMFGSGQAAMFIGGSWEIGIFTDKGANFDWFAPPLPDKNSVMQYCFHVDAGIGVNKNSKHLEEAKTFIKWAATPEFAQLFMNELPGFFAYTPSDKPYQLDNPVAAKMMDVAQHSVPTIRTVWEKLSDDYSANDLVGEALVRMYNGELSPEETAKYIQDKLDVWYPQIFSK